MEQLLAFVGFGLLGLITLYGYVSSMRAARETERGGLAQDRPMAGVAAE
jgi:hypothetical protein